jgi:hypothetical protein
MNAKSPLEGGCSCGSVRYRLLRQPMFVHCCHCSWCQRETGSAFALNALVETDQVKVLQGRTETVELPSASGKGQVVVHCPGCHVALWSHYAGGGTAIAFVRVGTLDHPEACPPDVHIFTSSKMPWVALPAETPAFKAYYAPKELWPENSQKRYVAAKKT